MSELQKLFYPESVLLYGVSESSRNMAVFTLMNLENFGFKGRIHLFGTKKGTIGNRHIFNDMKDIDDIPDLAVTLVPARVTPKALAECAQKGIRFAVIQSGGFSEFAGGEASALEKEMLETAARYGMRFAGPNCIGLINTDNGLVEPFFLIDPQVKKGHISFVAQSGGIAMDTLRFLDASCLGINKIFSIGNKLNLNECDYLDFLKDDPATEVIGFYLESFANGRRFMEIASQTNKPIACLKSNRVPMAQQIASFHTTALAGNDDVASCALHQAGVFRAETLSELMDFFKLTKLPPLRGNRIGIICRSGGQAVTFADAVGLYGFQLANFSDDLFDIVRKRVRAGVIRLTNPLDLGDVLDEEFYIEIVAKAAAQPDVDGLFLGQVYLNEFTLPQTELLLSETRKIAWKYNKPIMFYIIANKAHYFRLHDAADFPIFTDENRLLSVLARLYELSQKRDTGVLSFSATPTQNRHDWETGFLPPPAAYELLHHYGLPFPQFALAENSEQALQVARTLSYPLALKIGEEAVLHKTEKGGVILGIASAEELRAALTKIKARTLLIQEMTPKGIECFVGAKQDPEFGPTLFFGTGGVLVELFKDTALRLAPIDVHQARAMIEETKVAKLLKGFRNLPAGDIQALAEALVRISMMIFENPNIKNLDINPLIVFPPGEGCAIVDVKIEIG